MSDTPKSLPPVNDPMTIDPSNLGSVDPLSVEGLFLVALGKKGDERAAFLRESCPEAEQRERVEALLAAYENAGSFLQKPALSIEPTPVGQYLNPCELPGTLGKLGPYEILEEIGRGGMGVVFRAHDPQLQRIVAVKALAPELARLPTARQRFLREARAAAAISHPHVVTIFAVDGTEAASLGTERATLPYLVMECIVGQTLHDKIKRQGALKTEEIVRISRQIAEGLAAAHKRGLIHRDIKPANILLENGVERVKITDFGLARTTSDGGITHTGEILGTPQCMSPEQARGELVDQRSDLFSLGCVMYTMCTGVSPFRADNMLAVMKKVCESEPRPISQLNSDIPEWLCSLVHQLLEKQAELRAQTATEVVEVLEDRAVVSGQRAAHASPTREATISSAQNPEEVPRWLLTPIIPGLEQWLFKDRLLPVTLLAMLIGFFFGENRESRILMLPMAGVVGFGLLVLLKVLRKAPWNWINWKSMIAVPLGMFVGGVSRAWLIHQSRSGVGVLEELARKNAGWFVFPLAIAIFWFLTRYFRGLFIQNPQSASEAQSAPARPTHWSTWTILAMTVIVGGMLTLSPPPYSPGPNIMDPVLLIYFVALNIWIFVHLVAWGVRLAGSKDRTPPTAFPSGQVTRPQTTGSSQPLSPWRFLGWVLALTLGLGIVSSLGLAVALFVSWMAMSNAPNPTLTHSGPHPAYVTIRSSLGEKITGVTVDGSPAFLTSLGEGMCQLNIEPGSRSIIVSFESPDPQNYERVYSTLVNVSKSQAVEIEAVPVNQARKATATEIEARFEAALTLENDTARHNTLVRLAEDAANAGHGELVLKVIGAVKAGTARNNTCAICSESLLRQGLISAATAVAEQLDNDTSRNDMLARIANALPPPPIPQSSDMGPMGMLSASNNSSSSGTSLDRTGSSESPSIPLADSVEVLTDPATMPIYPYGIGTYGSNQLNTQVWINEPGLIVRLKPLDFEGQENSVVELVSNPAWGVGWFTGREDSFPVMDVPPGRYRVLVQDLDYGWSLDRRGTIIIGRGKQTIHVKRSFAGQQITPTEYPVPFRWAGKSYQLTTADQVSTINRYLAKLAGETAKPIPGTDAQGAGANMFFWNHPLYQQIDTNFPQLESSLKYSRQLLKLELPDDSVQESIVFDHPQGVISWKRSVPEGFHIPSGELKYHVSYEPGFWWPGEVSQTLDIETLKDQRLVIGRQTKAMMREAVNREYDFSQVQASTLIWFREQSTTIPIAALPAANRLILAWLDGQPDVPESELLARYPKDTMFESLWKMGLPADQLMPAILVPGSTPGTWRMKEPPEGAVADDPAE